MMTQILAFIAAYMGFLWDKGRFRITGSRTDGSNAVLYIESDVLRLQFVRDRGQLTLEFQPVGDGTAQWFSVDILRRRVLGKPEPSGLMDESYASFVGQHLDAIEHDFSTKNWPETRAQLKQFEAKRAKERFG